MAHLIQPELKRDRNFNDFAGAQRPTVIDVILPRWQWIEPAGILRIFDLGERTNLVVSNPHNAALALISDAIR